MYRINVKNYDVQGKEFLVKESIVNVLFGATEKLNGVELLRRDELAKDILGCEDEELLLEDTQYATVKGAIERFQGFGKAEIEFVKRILHAEKTKVAPVK